MTATFPLVKPLSGANKPRNVAPTERGIISQLIDRANGYVDVKADKGAVGDGTTNDTAAVQAAINAAGSAGVVFFPAGVYKVTGITVTDGIVLAGAGKDVSILLAASDGITILTASCTTPTSSTSRGPVLSSLGFRGNSSYTNCIAIQGNSWFHGEAEHLRFENCTWAVKINISYDLHLRKLSMVSGTSGIYATGAVDTVVSDSSLFVVGTPAGGIGVHVDSSCDGFEMVSVNVDHLETGFLINNAAASGDVAHLPLSTTVTNCQFGGGVGVGMDLEAFSGLLITSCIIPTMSLQGIKINYEGGVRIANSRAIGCGRSGIQALADNWEVLGGEYVNNGTAASNTYAAIDVGNGVSHWRVFGAALGQYGLYSNTQRAGIVVGTGSTDYEYDGCLFGTNISGNVIDGSGWFGRVKQQKLFQSLTAFQGNLQIGTTGAVTAITAHLVGSKTFDPPSIASLGTTTTTVTVSGAAGGDTCIPRFSAGITGLMMTAHVSGTDTVTVVFFNPTGSPVDLASGTLSVDVWQH